MLEEHGQEADRLLPLLSTLLDAQAAVAAMQQRSLRGTAALLTQLAVQVAAAWRQAGGGSADDLLAAHPAAPQDVIVALNAPAEAAAPADEAAAKGAAEKAGTKPDGGLAALRQRQAALREQLADAADLLRFWSRRSEKAASGAGAAGREGDVPPMLAEVRLVAGLHAGRAVPRWRTLVHFGASSSTLAAVRRSCCAGAAAAVGRRPGV